MWIFLCGSCGLKFWVKKMSWPAGWQSGRGGLTREPNSNCIWGEIKLFKCNVSFVETSFKKWTFSFLLFFIRTAYVTWHMGSEETDRKRIWYFGCMRNIIQGIEDIIKRYNKREQNLFGEVKDKSLLLSYRLHFYDQDIWYLYY